MRERVWVIGLLCLRLRCQYFGNILLQMFRISVISLDEVMIGSEVLDGSDQFEVLEHGRRDNVVKINVFGKKHHAIFEKTASNDFVVHLPQENYLELSVYAVLYQDSL